MCLFVQTAAMTDGEGKKTDEGERERERTRVGEKEEVGRLHEIED